MSSHHFVKEQQEPALILLDTAGVLYEDIAPLLEWVPTVLVSENCIDTVISWGIKIDIILASAQFLEGNRQLLEEQYPVKFLEVKGGNFLEEGLQYLIASKHTAVNIVGLGHRRVFDLEGKLSLINMVVMDGPMRYYPIPSPPFKKWFAAGPLHLHAPDGTLIEMKTSKESQLIKIEYATMVEVEEGSITFQSTRPFWIGEMTATP